MLNKCKFVCFLASKKQRNFYYSDLKFIWRIHLRAADVNTKIVKKFVISFFVVEDKSIIRLDFHKSRCFQIKQTKNAINFVIYLKKWCHFHSFANWLLVLHSICLLFSSCFSYVKWLKIQKLNLNLTDSSRNYYSNIDVIWKYFCFQFGSIQLE